MAATQPLKFICFATNLLNQGVKIVWVESLICSNAQPVVNAVSLGYEHTLNLLLILL
jgi:hypothetical protein